MDPEQNNPADRSPKLEIISTNQQGSRDPVVDAFLAGASPDALDQISAIGIDLTNTSGSQTPVTVDQNRSFFHRASTQLLRWNTLEAAYRTAVQDNPDDEGLERDANTLNDAITMLKCAMKSDDHKASRMAISMVKSGQMPTLNRVRKFLKLKSGKPNIRPTKHDLHGMREEVPSDLDLLQEGYGDKMSQ